MKSIKRTILDFQIDQFFSPIRTKMDYTYLLAYSIRLLLLEEEKEKEGQEETEKKGNVTNRKTDKRKTCIEPAKKTPYLKLVIDKMSRLFFYNDGKFFSISFPYNVFINDDESIEITNRVGTVINNQSVSEILTILNNAAFKINPSLVDFFLNCDNNDSLGIPLVEEIFQFEPAYLRYDDDKELEKGLIHPRHHLDINYSQYGTYKLGLKAAITDVNLEDLTDIRTECYFISQYQRLK